MTASKSRSARRAWRAALALALPGIALALPGPALAQTAPDPSEPATQQAEGAQIVVTGKRATESEIDEFVQAFTVAPRGTPQLARFQWEVCPVAAGVLPAQKLALAARMRQVAKAAALRVGGEKCSPNVLLIVTQDRKALMIMLGKRHPEYFTTLTRAEEKALRESTEPAIAWHLNGPPMSADGHEYHTEGGAGVYVNRTTRSATRIGFAARPQFAAAIVVVNSDALAGLTTTQLADYAAMRTFIRSDPARLAGSPAPTILKVLDAPMGSEIPLSLTNWDLNILRAFYASDPNARAPAQRTDMRRRLKQDLDKGQGTESAGDREHD